MLSRELPIPITTHVSLSSSLEDQNMIKMFETSGDGDTSESGSDDDYTSASDDDADATAVQRPSKRRRLTNNRYPRHYPGDRDQHEQINHPPHTESIVQGNITSLADKERASDTRLEKPSKLSRKQRADERRRIRRLRTLLSRNNTLLLKGSEPKGIPDEMAPWESTCPRNDYIEGLQKAIVDHQVRLYRAMYGSSIEAHNHFRDLFKGLEEKNKMAKKKQGGLKKWCDMYVQALAHKVETSSWIFRYHGLVQKAIDASMGKSLPSNALAQLSPEKTVTSREQSHAFSTGPYERPQFGIPAIVRPPVHSVDDPRTLDSRAITEDPLGSIARAQSSAFGSLSMSAKQPDSNLTLCLRLRPSQGIDIPKRMAFPKEDSMLALLKKTTELFPGHKISFITFLSIAKHGFQKIETINASRPSRESLGISAFGLDRAVTVSSTCQHRGSLPDIVVEV